LVELTYWRRFYALGALRAYGPENRQVQSRICCRHGPSAGQCFGHRWQAAGATAGLLMRMSAAMIDRELASDRA
jgi:hypothetical protein